MSVDDQIGKTLYSVSDLTKRWGVSKPVIFALFSSGALESCRLGGRRLCTLPQIARFERDLETGIAADVRVHSTKTSSI